MPLQKQNININLATSIDTKTDPKMVSGQKLARLENGRIDKIGTIKKRNGRDCLSVTTLDGVSTLASFPAKSFLHAHYDQTLLGNNYNLFSKIESSNKWAKVAPFMDCEVTAKNTSASLLSIVEHNFDESANYELHAMTVYSDPTSISAFDLTHYIIYSIIDKSTGSFVVKDKKVTGFVANDSGWSPRVFVYSDGTGAIAFQYDAGFNQSMYYIKLNLSTGAILSNSTIVTNIADMFGTPNLSWCATDAVKLPSTAPTGEGLAVLYVDTVAVSWKIAVFNTSGAATALPVKVLTTSFLTGDNRTCSLYYDGTNGLVAGVLGNQQNEVRIHSFTFTATTWSNVFQNVLFQTSPLTQYATVSIYAPFRTISIIKKPSSTSYLVFTEIDVYFNSTFGNETYNGAKSAIKMGEISAAGIVTAPNNLIAGSTFAAKPVLDTTRNAVYLLGLTDTPNQASYFLYDVTNLKSNGRPNVIARFDYGNVFGRMLTNCLPISIFANNQIRFAGVYKAAITYTRQGTYQENTNQFVYTGGARTFTLNLAPSSTMSRAFLNDTCLIGCGFLGQFDGVNFEENNFFIQPEAIQLSCEKTYGFTISQSNSGANYFQFVNFQAGAGIYQGTTYKMTLSTGDFTITYTKTGSSTTGATMNPVVRIEDWFSPYDVVSETCKVLQGNPSYTGTLDVFNINQIKFTTFTTPPNPVVTFAGGGPLTPTEINAGAYSYCAVLKYVDAQGNVHRSAPTAAKSITLTTGYFGSISVLVNLPLITLKAVNKIELEIYGTKANGTTFYKVSSAAIDDPFTSGWSGTTNRNVFLVEDQSTYGFTDWKKEASITAAQPILYTSGSVQENNSLGDVQMLTQWKNRIAAIDADDLFTVRYSKEAIKGEAVAFTDFNTFRIEADGQPVKGLGVLDDKLIIFKERKAYYVSGDGANDLGSNVTLSTPTLISSDVGCVEHKSIVQTPSGLLFKSQKGIYLLDRGLNLAYVGAAVENFNQYTIARSVLFDSINEVRFYLSNSPYCLVFNYLVNVWSTFTNYQSDDAIIKNGVQITVNNSGRVFTENQATYRDNELGVYTTYQLLLETAWLKVAGLQNFQRVFGISLLGEYKSPHNLTFNLSYDYDPVSTNSISYTYDPSATAAGTERDDQVYQPSIKPEIQKCQSIKILISEAALGGSYESVSLTDLAFSVGMKSGLNKTRDEKTL